MEPKSPYSLSICFHFVPCAETNSLIKLGSPNFGSGLKFFQKRKPHFSPASTPRYNVFKCRSLAELSMVRVRLKFRHRHCHKYICGPRFGIDKQAPIKVACKSDSPRTSFCTIVVADAVLE